MRTTVDIADDQYSRLKLKAIQEGNTVKGLIRTAVENLLNTSKTSPSRHFTLPVIRSKAPGGLKIDNDSIQEYLDI